MRRSPTFLAPGTSFVEDNFSADGGRGGGWFRRECERWGAADEAWLTCPPASPLLLYGPVPNRPVPVRSQGVGAPAIMHGTAYTIKSCLVWNANSAEVGKPRKPMVLVCKVENLDKLTKTMNATPKGLLTTSRQPLQGVHLCSPVQKEPFL